MAINAAGFKEALQVIQQEKGISEEVIVEAIKDAMERGYRKELGADDADVRCFIDVENGTIEMYYVKKVVKEVEDDVLEIDVAEAKKVGTEKSYKVGDECFIEVPVEVLKRATATSIKAVLKQKFAEAERLVLYENYKDKINTMITGTVEKADERGVTVNIGRTSVFLPQSHMIGDEKFNAGDSIKLYVSAVENSGSKGGKITVSRASEGFLKCLLTEEINEIYNGTIVIKKIARRAGERSKVALVSNDPNIDPAGICIGPNGTRIQKVVSQLGNGNSKEKIDIIAYSDTPEFFIIEALKPCKALGVSINEEEKKATAVVADDALTVAIGRRGVNVSLASKLTGYSIDVKPESEAVEEGFEYMSYTEALARATESKAQDIRLKQKEEEVSPVLRGLPEGYVAPQERVYEDETSDELEEVLTEQLEKEEANAPKEVVKEEEPKLEEAPAEEVKQEEKPAPVEEKREVKTTTTLADLEKSLEDEAKKNAQSKKTTKKKKVEEEKEESVVLSDPSKRMSIYTEEELREIEEEEANQTDEYEDDDVDYDEYDEYYDDDDDR